MSDFMNGMAVTLALALALALRSTIVNEKLMKLNKIDCKENCCRMKMGKLENKTTSISLGFIRYKRGIYFKRLSACSMNFHVFF